MTLPTLPVYYYLDHFRELLEFVGTTYPVVLNEEHRSFISRFHQLSRDSQCLLIRMINRKGSVFSRDRLNYVEIGCVDLALVELQAAGHVRGLQLADYGELLLTLSKTKLVHAARVAGFNPKPSWSKPKLIEFFRTDIPYDRAIAPCGGSQFVVLDNIQPVQFLLYLYFGKTEVDLKNFALRDLGVIRTNDASSFSARFSNAEEARACFYYSQILDRIETETLSIYETAAKDFLNGPPCQTDFAVDLSSRVALETGRFFEKRGDYPLAEKLFRVGTSAECHERLVRLLYKMGDKGTAETMLKRMIDDPASDEEHIFATDFYARRYGGHRRGLHTELLRAARTLVIDDTHRGNPEAGAAGVMRRQGATVFFAENTLWLSLFGLLFWDELFESGQLHSGFDWLPQCLKERSFRKLFASQIDAKLAAVKAGDALPLILKSVASKWGRPNGVFVWNRTKIEAIRALLIGAKREGIATILSFMCDDFLGMRDGFPDLMLLQGGAVSFVEVKSDGDTIRRNQLTRLRQLVNVGIPAEICRVDFKFDPEQDYVVVDIETTGSWSSGDRVTEIGAVKIRNHDVIEEWHSLVNPQRSIPANITRLTGITNAMVRDAPVFAEIADSFLAFMGDAIFVAHNVNFDYGFIVYEFERLERRFRFPKLCTCVGMRRRFPGHKSYSLASLCDVYDIRLAEHHRALCDAQAAGQLLNMINQKRTAEAVVEAA